MLLTKISKKMSYKDDSRKTLRLSILLFIVSALMALVININGQGLNNDNQSAGTYATELTGGSWVLTDVEQKSHNGINLTKWKGAQNEIDGAYSWKDILDIVHTVNSGFKWEEPPKNMRPGDYLNIEAIYNNLDYSTTSNVKTGIKIFIDRVGTNYMVPNSDAIEILKVNKDNRQNLTEVKKGFFNAPETLFDDTKQCQLIIDCYVGKDHYVTTYTYTYQQ